MRQTVAVAIIREVEKKVAADVKKTKAAGKVLKTAKSGKWLYKLKNRLLIIIINSNCRRINLVFSSLTKN